MVVTAAYNEADKLPALARSLAEQRVPVIARWVIVDDGSTDGTAAVAHSLADLPFPVTVLSRANAGGLRAASELGAFREGAERALRLTPEATRVVKVDADLRLHPDCLGLLAQAPQGTGIVGGIIEQPDERAQTHHVRGGLRAYSREAWEIAVKLPVALGWDVLDQVAVRSAGLGVLVVPGATTLTARTTGSSAGLLAGRRRLGEVCRLTGYWPPYVLLKLARTFAQRPRVLGGVAFLVGYASARSSPYDPGLLAAHRAEQRARLLMLLRHPRAARHLYAGR